MGWVAHGLTFRYPHAAALAIDCVTLDVPSGVCTALIGPNGAGKSTLLHLLLGALAPMRGEVRFEGRTVGEWPRDELARSVGVVPQGEDAPFPLAVRELVAMGRYPHLGAWRRESDRDEHAIANAMRRADVAQLAERAMSALSGGERQRVRLARALAQEPRALALDEPTAALDIRHEMEMFELLRALSRQGATVLLATHQINLAARYADRLVLLDQGRLVAAGAPVEVLTQARVEQVYDWPVRVVPHAGPGVDSGAPQVVALAGERGVRAVAPTEPGGEL